jgi:Tfp pilus assembly protein PilF
MAELEAVLFKALNHKNDSPSGVSVTADDAEGESAARVEVGLALADLYLMTGQDSLAESAYRQVLELQPDHVNALNNTAWLLFVAQRQLPFAARLVQRAIDSVGERADLLDTRGCVHLARGNNQAAAEDFTRALQLGAGPDSTFHLAVALQRSGEKDAARETLADARTHGFELAQVSPFEKRLALEIAD